MKIAHFNENFHILDKNFHKMLKFCEKKKEIILSYNFNDQCQNL